MYTIFIDSDGLVEIVTPSTNTVPYYGLHLALDFYNLKYFIISWPVEFVPALMFQILKFILLNFEL